MQTSKWKEEGNNKRQCFRCGHTDHIGRDPKCPARGQTCHKRNGKERLSKACRTKWSKRQRVNNIEEQYDFAVVVNENDGSDRLTFCLGGVEC